MQGIKPDPIPQLAKDQWDTFQAFTKLVVLLVEKDVITATEAHTLAKGLGISVVSGENFAAHLNTAVRRVGKTPK